MELIQKENIKEFNNPGCYSKQLLNIENSKSERVTLTEVHVSPGASQPRHLHETSEQIWYAINGNGKLLLDNEKEIEFSIGDVVRFADGEIHGVRNDSYQEFVYISITSPPVNFRIAYLEEK